jgi:membrane-bound lytic murein transglycosylase D
LVLAAYNWGPGNVQRVMKRTGKRNYWDLHPHMPQETRNYVPSFTAILYAMKHADQHQLRSPDLNYQYAQEMDTLQLGGRLFDVSRLSVAVGLDSVAMLRFNPELRRHYLPEGYRPYAVKFPAIYRSQLQEVNRATLFEFCRPAAALPPYLTPLPPRLEGVDPFPTAATYASAKNPPARDSARQHKDTAARTQRKMHTVKRGQTLGELASWYGVSPADLRRWNNLRKGQDIRPKQQLVVFLPAKEHEDATVNTAVAVRPTTMPAVAAVTRTAAEMNVRVKKQPVAPVTTPAQSAEVVAADTMPEPALTTPEPRAVATRPAAKKPALASAQPEALQPDATPEPAAEATPAATEYVVRKGDYLTKVAREHNLTVAQLLEWNGMKSEVVTPGQKLRLTAPDETATTVASAAPAKPAAPASVATANKKQQPRELTPEQHRVHIVQPGDTLYNISRRYQGLTVEQLRKLNRLKSDEVKPGQKLIVAS